MLHGPSVISRLIKSHVLKKQMFFNVDVTNIIFQFTFHVSTFTTPLITVILQKTYSQLHKRPIEFNRRELMSFNGAYATNSAP